MSFWRQQKGCNIFRPPSDVIFKLQMGCSSQRHQPDVCQTSLQSELDLNPTNWTQNRNWPESKMLTGMAYFPNSSITNVSTKRSKTQNTLTKLRGEGGTTPHSLHWFTDMAFATSTIILLPYSYEQYSKMCVVSSGTNSINTSISLLCIEKLQMLAKWTHTYSSD